VAKVSRFCPAELAAMRAWLEHLYLRYHTRDHLGSDPIQFVHRFSDTADQEIAGLIASSLAYGNVTSIHRSTADVLGRMSEAPSQFLYGTTEPEIRRVMAGFRHRWTGEAEIGDLLIGIKRVSTEYGGLGRLFFAADDAGPDVTVGLKRWVDVLQRGLPNRRKNLLSDPARSSACKRLHLYLRWMVRHDAIDPGCWPGIHPARLLMPLDTHIFGFARACGFTRRASADGMAVQEITGVFRQIAPDDPIRYDFALTRPGIIDGWRPGKHKPWLVDDDGSRVLV
jgi:uncharacterized protein (TIGR02757 family)